MRDIEREFGAQVSELVYWLTDVSRPEDGNRSARKALDCNHIAQAPTAAKTVKLADLISKSRSILVHDRRFARVYVPEKAALLEVLRDGGAALWAQTHPIVEDAWDALKLGRSG